MLLRGEFQSLNSLNNLTEEQNNTLCLSRRGFLQVAAAAAGSLVAGPVLAGLKDKERCISVYAPNTGEMLRMVYWTPADGYIDESVRELSQLMRDRHDGTIKLIDAQLIDQLYTLQLQLQPRQPMHVLCGYRSPRTNAKLRRTNRGVARDSLHMRGQAADIRMPDRDFRTLHRAAMSLKAGGVGRYRRSRFVHLDSGPVRSWG